jgi:four helix bundle protein
MRDLKERTKEFALQTIKFVESLPAEKTADIIGRQLLRAATSVGANYRAASRAKSRPDFISKMGTVEEEADECLYWLEILEGSGKVRNGVVTPLKHEGSELLAITISSIKTARKNRKEKL